MRIILSDHFKKQIAKVYKKNPQLRKKVVKQTGLFAQDQYYPSLKTHKLEGNRSNQFAFWVHDDVRIIFIRDGNDFIFTEILTSHNQY